jgi:glycosyltransferase involved in cell wall biosynthesis
MNILVIHNQLWAHYKSKLFESIANELTQNAPNSSFYVAQIALYEESRKAMMRQNQGPRYEYPHTVLFNSSLESVNVWSKTWKLIRLFFKHKPTILNITGYYDPAQLILLCLAKLWGVKTVISTESSVQDQQRSSGKEYFKKQLFKFADGFICFGSSSSAYLAGLGVSSEKILTTKAAIVDETYIAKRFEDAGRNPTDDTPNRARRRFIYVGRFSREKNLHQLLRVFGRLSGDWELHLVGDGPERAALEHTITELALSRCVLHPACAWYEVPDQLAQADVLVLPSISEPWGLVINEAMICRMPIVASEACGAVKDLVKNDYNGFTFTPNDDDGLALALEKFIRNPSLIAAFGERSKQLIANYSSAVAAREIVKGYQRLASKDYV